MQPPIEGLLALVHQEDGEEALIAMENLDAGLWMPVISTRETTDEMIRLQSNARLLFDRSGVKPAIVRFSKRETIWRLGPK